MPPRTRYGLRLALTLLLVPIAALAGEFNWSGYLKGRYNGTSIPDDSLLRELAPSRLDDWNADTRFNLRWRGDALDLRVDYNLIASRSDSMRFLSAPGGGTGDLLPLPAGEVINDDRRWWNLTDVLHESDAQSLVQRLDRLSIGYTGARVSLRFGRQAISWGNGLIYTPMDIFNPFDPLAVDTEYKTGDDMLYGQWLFDSGNDLQGVAVVRREPLNGDVSGDVSSLAFKYHALLGTREVDLLLAEHYDDTVLGLGGLTDLGEAILRGDLTLTRTGGDTTVSGVVNLSYSWVWGGRNVSGILEVFHNGFGQSGQAYTPSDLLANRPLARRLERGELFTLGRNYLATSLLVEISPLFNLSPNLFFNLGDPSGLLQVVGTYDWRQDLQLVGSVNLPFGADGTEYGGIPSGFDDRDLETGPGLFVQLAYYF